MYATRLLFIIKYSFESGGFITLSMHYIGVLQLNYQVSAGGIFLLPSGHYREIPAVLQLTTAKGFMRQYIFVIEFERIIETWLPPTSSKELSTMFAWCDQVSIQLNCSPVRLNRKWMIPKEVQFSNSPWYFLWHILSHHFMGIWGLSWTNRRLDISNILLCLNSNVLYFLVNERREKHTTCFWTYTPSKNDFLLFVLTFMWPGYLFQI